MGKKNALAELALLVAVIGGLTAGLHLLGAGEALRVDWADPVRWLSNATPVEAIGATLRTVGLAIGYWITLSTALYAVVMRRRRGRPPRLLALLTLPGVRHVVDRALATALTASLAVSPFSLALSDEPPPPPVVFDINRDGIPIPHVSMDSPPRGVADEAPTLSQQTPIAPPVMVPGPGPGIVSRSVPPPTAVQAATTTAYTVQSGDSLWLIAERHIPASPEGAPAAATITAYWRLVVTANQGTLRSGDPNLIFPGEIIELPVYEVTP